MKLEFVILNRALQIGQKVINATKLSKFYQCPQMNKKNPFKRIVNVSAIHRNMYGIAYVGAFDDAY